MIMGQNYMEREEPKNKVGHILALALIVVWLPPVAVADSHATDSAQIFSSEEIDALVARALDVFQVPGMAVGVIKDGVVIHAKGYGVLQVGKAQRIDEKTLFGIASNGKAFTAAALALLVDDGVLAWDDSVVDHLPQFQMFDPWVTREIQVRDLLIHNSGLPLGAGDLMLFPSEGFTREEIMHNLRYLRPATSFRSEYAYDNLLYIVAGELIAAVSGNSYEDFIDERVLEPLGMHDCGANLSRFVDYGNVAKPHVVIDGRSTVVESTVEFGQQTVSAAAGGIVCGIESYLKWHDMHLRNGERSDGSTFLSKEQHAELTSAHMIMNEEISLPGKFYGSVFNGYGLGWIVSDHNGYKKVWHTGADIGMVSANALFPELNVGIAVFTNQQSVGARLAVFSRLQEIFTGSERTDWVSVFDKAWKERVAEAAASIPDLVEVDFTPIRPLEEYAGTYRDPWFGDVQILNTDDGLYFRSVRSERLKGRIDPYKPDLFIVTWEDRSLEADAYLNFAVDFDGKPSAISMKAVSPLTDFSFDFHDLDLQRVSE